MIENWLGVSWLRLIGAFLVVIWCGFGCGLLGAKAIEAATPVAISAAKKLVQSVADYVLSTGKEAKQVNCEEEWYPDEGELLILCTVKYEESKAK